MMSGHYVVEILGDHAVMDAESRVVARYDHAGEGVHSGWDLARAHCGLLNAGAMPAHPVTPDQLVELAGATVVSCDEACGARLEPSPLSCNDLYRAYHHWRWHSLSAGCSHGA